MRGNDHEVRFCFLNFPHDYIYEGRLELNIPVPCIWGKYVIKRPS